MYSDRTKLFDRFGLYSQFFLKRWWILLNWKISIIYERKRPQWSILHYDDFIDVLKISSENDLEFYYYWKDFHDLRTRDMVIKFKTEEELFKFKLLIE